MAETSTIDSVILKEELQLQRWIPLVRSRVNSFRSSGLEPDDLMQEGLIGLLYAIRAFDADQGASFKTFAYICITRRLSKAVKKADSDIETVSIDDDDRMLLPDTDLQNAFESREYLKNWLDDAYKMLSEREAQVFKLYLAGKSYRQTSEMLKISEKAVDNAICRAKNKLRAIKF